MAETRRQGAQVDHGRGLFADPSILTVLLPIQDVLVICLAAGAAFRWYLEAWLLPDNYRAVVVVALLLMAVVFPQLGAYRAWREKSIFAEVRLVVVGWLAVVLGLTAIAFIGKIGAVYSRGWMISWTALSITGLAFARVAVRLGLRWARSRGLNRQPAVIAGPLRLTCEVVERLQATPWAGVEVVGCFSDDLPDSSPGGVPWLGRLDEMAAYVLAKRIPQVWLAFPLKQEDEVHRLLHALRHSTADIHFVPDIFGFRLLNHSVASIAGFPVLNLTATPMVGASRLTKALEDRLLALLIILLVSPLMLFIAIGVKLSSPGPVLFKQYRNGWDGRRIKVYKFRTMRLHQEEAGALAQATAHDQRVTRFGALLRRTSLDELPQFFNVLQGRMSIVGPRPHAIVHNERYKELIDFYMLRHKVKPGITGWAQVNGYRGETDTVEKMRKRVECDLFYIENWSLWFDLKIILLTVLRGFVSRNAY